MLDDTTEEQMVAEARKVVEDATDWAEAQSDPDPATWRTELNRPLSRKPPARKAER